MGKKVVIVGAGPAGLFAAYKLANADKGLEIKVLDKGLGLNTRKCPSPDRCIKCNLCNILHGIGGAGLFSDGKIIYHTMIGTNMHDILDPKKHQELVNATENIFSAYGVRTTEYDEKKQRLIKKILTKANQKDIKAVFAKYAHVGTDKLVGLIADLQDDLIAKGVEFLTKTEVLDITDHEVKCSRNRSFEYDHLLLAPGRVGAEWLEGVVQKLNIDYFYNPLDIGVRVEVKREITDLITNITRDMKFYIKTETYRDWVRTFCTCPGGKVTRETYGEFNLVNGHSEYGDPYENTNFAFLVSLRLTKPLGNSNQYGRIVAEIVNTTGKGDPVLQQLGDLRRGRRSYKDKLRSALVQPSLSEGIIYGDIGMALPYRIMLDILEGLDKLNLMIPGVANDSTLLYAPEIKFHGLRVKTDEYLETNKDNVFVAGDGAGISRGIAGAASSGLLAAEGILKKQ